jgi:hypothetical protein
VTTSSILPHHAFMLSLHFAEAPETVSADYPSTCSPRSLVHRAARCGPRDPTPFVVWKEACRLPFGLGRREGGKGKGASYHSYRHAVTRDQAQALEEAARVGRQWRMLMLEDCRLGLCGNSNAGKIGLPGCQRRGGLVAPKSTTGSVVSLVIDQLAATHGAVVQRCLNTSKIEVASADPPLRGPGPLRLHEFWPRTE